MSAAPGDRPTPVRAGPVAVWLALAAALVLARPAPAVILAGGDGSGNTTPPADDFGFAHVGSARETAVYLGNGWVITANHVQEGEVTLGGVRYPAVEGSKRRLHNAGGGVSADVALFRLQEPVPGLAALPIRATSPEPGDPVVLVGNGPNRGEPTEFDGHPGWRWGEGRRLRWGTNRVHAVGLDVQAGVGDLTHAFSTRLSPVDPSEYEATVAVGDSGGGAFIKNGDTWELAGVLFAASTWDDQPPQTTLYGNVTFAADLSIYRDQILAVTAPPACRDGLDDDGDGRVDWPADPGCQDADDPRERSGCETPALAGDANGDGRVDGHDYTLWADRFGTRGPEAEAADFDCDGFVGPGDYAIWQASYATGQQAGQEVDEAGRWTRLLAAVVAITATLLALFVIQRRRTS